MATLVVTEGPAKGSHFPLAMASVSIGRDDTCSFQILDPRVSRTHLQVRFDDALGTHVAADYRSAHGVYVNDARIVLDTTLRDGDSIRIGGTTMMYLAADCADAAAASEAVRKRDEWKRSTVIGR
ncbi:MAG: FHA domain-containing protein [Phycisphaerae bacterium]|nr:FHA domain-containing protein [Phycisphaerae bacterium]